MADLRGRQGRPPPPRLGLISFIFIQFLGKIWRNNTFLPSPLRLAPQDLGNSGSATALSLGVNWVQGRTYTYDPLRVGHVVYWNIEDFPDGGTKPKGPPVY